jgi:hypothetical protein
VPLKTLSPPLHPAPPEPTHRPHPPLPSSSPSSAAAELFSGLIDRLSATRAALSPRQAVSAVWAAARLGSWMPRVASLGVRHLGDHLERYEAVDVIGMLWACVQLNGSVPGALCWDHRGASVWFFQRAADCAWCGWVWGGKGGGGCCAAWLLL